MRPRHAGHRPRARRSPARSTFHTRSGELRCTRERRAHRDGLPGDRQPPGGARSAARRGARGAGPLDGRRLVPPRRAGRRGGGARAATRHRRAARRARARRHRHRRRRAGRGVDIVSRVFAPNLGIDEDPVTGSAHCQLAPWWARAPGPRRAARRAGVGAVAAGSTCASPATGSSLVGYGGRPSFDGCGCAVPLPTLTPMTLQPMRPRRRPLRVHPRRHHRADDRRRFGRLPAHRRRPADPRRRRRGDRRQHRLGSRRGRRCGAAGDGRGRLRAAAVADAGTAWRCATCSSTAGCPTASPRCSSPAAAARAPTRRCAWPAPTRWPRAGPTRWKVVGRHPSYHGMTLGTMAVASHSGRQAGFEPLLLPFPKVPWDDPQAVLDVIEREGPGDDRRVHRRADHRRRRRVPHGERRVLAHRHRASAGATTSCSSPTR